MSKKLIQKTQDDYTVGIICAMSFEMSAVRYMLDNEHEMPIEVDADVDPTSYTLGDVHGLNVVLGCLSGQQGKGAAAIVAANMSRTFPHIKWRLLVGIGGGVPSETHDIRLGDVVVSMPEGQYGGVVQYDLGKSTDTEFKLKGFLQPPPSRLRGAVERMQSDHLVRDNKILEFLETMVRNYPRLATYRQPKAADVLHFETLIDGTAGSSAEHPQSSIVQRPPRELEGPYIHYGLIASGDSVLKSATKRSELVQKLGDVLCFEMEAAGPMSEYPCIVIRGVSDYADSHKNDDWHKYAAATAAGCAKELLSYLKVNAVSAASESASSASERVTQTRAIEWHQQPTSVFRGRGIQHAGSGNFTIGGDINIS